MGVIPFCVVSSSLQGVLFLNVVTSVYLCRYQLFSTVLAVGGGITGSGTQWNRRLFMKLSLVGLENCLTLRNCDTIAKIPLNIL
jgi:hypothetical protein